MERKELVEMIKLLNGAEELLKKVGCSKIKVVGKGTTLEELKDQFRNTLIKIDDADLIEEAPKASVKFFEDNLDEFKEGVCEVTDAPVSEEEEEELEDEVEEEDDPEEEEVEDEDKDKTKSRSEVVEYLSKFIKEGKYTRKELIEKSLINFPDKSKEAIGTYLSDGKNPKYNRFHSLLMTDKEGRISFDE